ncbi:MAG: VTT domain-containing protein [Lysobacteraceae bacterium]
MKWRAVLILALCVSVAVLLSIDSFNAGLHRLLSAAEPAIAAHPVSGVLLFVALSAFSAVIAFFSSALLVPVAVYTWGMPLTGMLLWLGWWLGGAFTYALGHALRRPLIRMAGHADQLDFYRRRVPADAGFAMILLLQIALPSEIPGYLCGVMRVPFRTYALALALAELPYALGTVWIGESLLQQRTGLLLALGVLGAVASAYAVRRLRQRLSRLPPL